MTRLSLPPDMLRRSGERLCDWLNRVKAWRGGSADLEWVETSDGNLRLRSRINPQSKLDFGQ